jgi:hypothetical protein
MLTLVGYKRRWSVFGYEQHGYTSPRLLLLAYKPVSFRKGVNQGQT